MSYDAVTKRVAYHVFGNSMQEDVDAIIDYRAVSKFVFKNTSRFAFEYVKINLWVIKKNEKLFAKNWFILYIKLIHKKWLSFFVKKKKSKKRKR